jgi:hypothetical protein
VLKCKEQQICEVDLWLVPKLSRSVVQGAAEITPTFRKITVGSPKQIVGCGPFRSVGYIIKFSVVAMPWSGEHRGFVVAAF